MAGNQESKRLTTVKNEAEISGFANLLREKLISEKTTWDITLEAVEHLDTMTDSSIGSCLGVLCVIDPKPNSVITYDHIKAMSKESVLEANGVKNMFELYSMMNKNGMIEKIFKR